MRTDRLWIRVVSGDVTDQTLPSAVLVHHHGGLGHRVMLCQSRFDLFELDAQTADLHLEVDPAEVLECAVREAPYPVAGAVHQRPGRAEHTRDKTFGSQVRTPEVPACQLVTGQVQLTHRTHRAGPEPPVEDKAAGVPDRPADRRRIGTGCVPVQVRPRYGDDLRGGIDGDLGGPVEVHHLRAGDVGHTLGKRHREGLATTEHRAQ